MTLLALAAPAAALAAPQTASHAPPPQEKPHAEKRQVAEASDAAVDVAFLDRISSAFNRAARIAKSSVVSVQTVSASSRRDTEEQGSASGVVFDSNGHIVTSYHVVEGATQIEITTADGRNFKARVVGTDPKTDVAVLRVNAPQLPPAKFADSSTVEVGQLVLAVGSPFMLAQTVSHGIVSATGRSEVEIEGVEYKYFIQTDAPTNPGNSGGALVNTRGEVIGINTAIATKSGQFSGVAFATPSNTVVWAARGIISGRPLLRGYLGVAIRSLSADLAEEVGLKSHNGIVIEKVTTDSPASRAGLREQDIVLYLDRAKIIDRAHFSTLIAEVSPGSRTTMMIWREGRQHKLEVVVGEQPPNF